VADRKYHQPNRIHQVEGNRNAQPGLLGHQVADALLVQRLGDHADPQQVEHQHHGDGGGISG
jgi:hypothetical protein